MSTDFWTSSSRYGLVHKMRVVLAAWRTSHNRYISALHYLYYLVVARKHGVHVFELSQELPQLLKPGGPFECPPVGITIEGESGTGEGTIQPRSKWDNMFRVRHRENAPGHGIVLAMLLLPAGVSAQLKPLSVAVIKSTRPLPDGGDVP